VQHHCEYACRHAKTSVRDQARYKQCQRKREYPVLQLSEGIASGHSSETRWDRHGHSKTSLFRGRVERRLVTREDDSALQALGGLQFMFELAFWAAHPGWPDPL
jgi:hypothetical protein